MRVVSLFFCLAFLISCASQKVNKEDQIVFWINSSEVPCEGVGTMNCLQIKKGENPAEKPWQAFYQTIEGFHFVKGYTYKLLVKTVALPIESIPAVGSTISYSLLEVLEKRMDPKYSINDIWVIESINGERLSAAQFSKLSKTPTLELNASSLTFMGNNGCNLISGSLSRLNETAIKFGPMRETRMICPNMSIPNTISSLLGIITNYKIEGTMLLLQSSENTPVFSLKKVD